MYNRGLALLKSHTRRMNLEKIFWLNMLSTQKEKEKKEKIQKKIEDS